MSIQCLKPWSISSSNVYLNFYPRAIVYSQTSRHSQASPSQNEIQNIPNSTKAQLPSHQNPMVKPEPTFPSLRSSFFSAASENEMASRTFSLWNSRDGSELYRPSLISSLRRNSHDSFFHRSAVRWYGRQLLLLSKKRERKSKKERLEALFLGRRRSLIGEEQLFFVAKEAFFPAVRFYRLMMTTQLTS